MKALFRSLAFVLFLLPNLSSAYWQQEVNYTIDVALNDEKHELSGFIQMEYVNNSPDTLHYIFIHLWPNAYKNEQTALGKQLMVQKETKFHWSKEADKGFIDKLEFKINDKAATWDFYNQQIDIAKIILAQPLLSGQKITITTPFRVKIPLGVFSRLGHISQSYQITQWYPKPAVYDATGWHPMNYLDQGEFYSEFGSYNVKITLPENYVVGATGDLQGESGVKEMEWLLYKVKQTEEKIKKLKDDDWGMDIIKFSDSTLTPSSKQTKTLHYYQQNVHDFAWFADKDWNVLKGEVLLPYSKRKVDTWVMFSDKQASLWEKSLTYVQDATYKYSLWNGEYPYNHVTAVDASLSAGSGMEYPNITVIGDAHDDMTLEQVIMHEVGHNWFYGILGSNERRNAWMDEGINSFNEMRYMKEKFPKEKISAMVSDKAAKFFGANDPDLSEMPYLSYLYSALKGQDQKLDLTSEDFSSYNYGGIVYSKSAIIFNYLFSYLGAEKFDYCMKMYFNQWKFKHPQPKDLEQIFTENCKEDLSWFFNDLLKTDKVVDYQILLSEDGYGDSLDVVVKNTGEIKSPVLISILNDNDSVIHEVWFDGFKETRKLLFMMPAGLVPGCKIMIDGRHCMPEINRSNNILNACKIFQTIEPIKFSLVTNLENPKYNNLYLLPTLAYNSHDRFMLGLALHNYQFPLKNTRFWINPNYSFTNKITNGDAHLRYFIRKPLPFLSGMEAGVAVKQYSIQEYAGMSAQFQKFEPSIRFIFKKKDANSPITTELLTRMVRINDELIAGLGDNKYEIQNDWNNYFEGKLLCTKKAATSSFYITSMLQSGPDFMKASITADFRFKVNEKGQEFKVRFFGGKFLDQTAFVKQQFTLRGQRDEDYLYDNPVLGRNLFNPTYVLSQQIYTADGGFKFGLYGKDIRGTNWMTAVNLTYDLPLKFIALFVDLGTSDGILNNSASSFYYDSGIQLTLYKDVAEIYFPLFMSEELSNSYETALTPYNYFQKIRFLLNFNNMNLLNRLKNL